VVHVAMVYLLNRPTIPRILVRPKLRSWLCHQS